MNLRLLLCTLSVFFISSCATQNLSLYTAAGHEQPNFKVTPVSSNFYAVDSNNEQLLISKYENTFYKFNAQGTLIDTLNFQDGVGVYVQPENHFIYIEDGYFPNWVKTGDKTKKGYAQYINADLKMDAEAIKQLKVDDNNFKYKDEQNSTVQERYDFLDQQAEKFQLLKLLKTYKEKSQYTSNAFFGTRENVDLFVINNEVIKVNVPLDLAYFNDKIVKEPRDKLSVAFQEKIKPSHFEKIEWVKRRWNIFSGASYDGYWLGNAYYNIPVGNAIYKLKLENSLNDDAEIKVGRFIFPQNKHFILIRTADRDNYFIQALLGNTR